MTLLKEYILPRIVQWLVVIFVGVTMTFLIPRLSPVNPVDQAMGRLQNIPEHGPECCTGVARYFGGSLRGEGQHFRAVCRVLEARAAG